jgi:hypothetical protein
MAEGLNARETLLVFLAAGITLLAIMSVYAVYSQDYRPAILSSALAAALIYIYFRHRMVLLSLVALSFLLVTAGLNNLAHPTVPGYITTFGSVGGLCLLIGLRSRKRSQLGHKHTGSQGMHKLFDKDGGDAL